MAGNARNSTTEMSPKEERDKIEEEMGHPETGNMMEKDKRGEARRCMILSGDIPPSSFLVSAALLYFAFFVFAVQLIIGPESTPLTNRRVRETVTKTKQKWETLGDHISFPFLFCLPEYLPISEEDRHDHIYALICYQYSLPIPCNPFPQPSGERLKILIKSLQIQSQTNIQQTPIQEDQDLNQATLFRGPLLFVL